MGGGVGAAPEGSSSGERPGLRLRRHPRAPELLRRRALALRTLRAQLDGEGFLEADVPLLLPHAGQEPWLHAPEVLLPGLPSPLWLQTSPELPLKRLLCAGIPRLYALGAAYRAGREELSTHHQPQFCMLEWYEPGESVQRLVERVRRLGAALAEALQLPAVPAGESLELAEAFQRWAGVDLIPLLDGDRERFAALASETGLALRPQDDVASLVGRVLVERVEPALAAEPGWVFLHGYPAELAALARLDPDDDRKALRVEAYLRGVELANGYVELMEADELSARWAADRGRRDGPSPPMDQDLLRELREAAGTAGGIPSTVGMALGIDRLLMTLLGEDRLDAVLPLSLHLGPDDSAP